MTLDELKARLDEARAELARLKAVAAPTEKQREWMGRLTHRIADGEREVQFLTELMEAAKKPKGFVQPRPE